MSKIYSSKHNSRKNITRIERKNSSGFFAFGTQKLDSLDFTGCPAFFISPDFFSCSRLKKCLTLEFCAFKLQSGYSKKGYLGFDELKSAYRHKQQCQNGTAIFLCSCTPAFYSGLCGKTERSAVFPVSDGSSIPHSPLFVFDETNKRTSLNFLAYRRFVMNTNTTMDVISMELNKFINNGFPRNSKPIQEDVFNITNNQQGALPMQNQLIPINTDSNGQQTVNARDLHEFLENKDHFATWIKDRIIQYDFVENQDFVIFSEFSEKGRPKQEYHITIDMAKELSMVEKNAKGKEARKYFIMCERIAKELTKPRELSTLEILEIAMKNEKARLAAIAERDDAIKTKAWIGDKKVATSMATASVAVRQAENLKEQIGNSKKWKTVKAIPWLRDVFELSKPAYKAIGSQLSKLSKALGYNITKVPDTEWGNINAYHSDVIEQFKHKLMYDLNMLRIYRKPLN